MFFFNDTATTEIYTLSLHDALPIFSADHQNKPDVASSIARGWYDNDKVDAIMELTTSSVALAVQQLSKDKKKRSEEHTSELQSRQYLVCRLLLEKKS